MSERRPQVQWSLGAAGPVLAGEDWWDFALCAQTDPEVFFPAPGDSAASAKRVCMACEVRSECLAYALEHSLEHGIWGGKSAKERAA